MKYNKPSLSIDEQIELLESRGLILNDISRTKRHLSSISYYRLSAYMIYFMEKDSLGSKIDKFKPDTTWNKIIDLYRFDRKFRLLIFDAIERIEIGLRTQLIQQLSQKYGSHWHTNPALFKILVFDSRLKNEKHYRNIFNEINDHIREQIDSNKSMEFIKHYINKYTEPDTPPSWMSIEIMYFNHLSLICKALSNKKDLSDLSSYFSLPNEIFISWMHTINYIRNICAHHSRLWNITLQVNPAKLKYSKRLKWISNTDFTQTSKMYYSICLIMYFLQTINPNSKFKHHFLKLCDEFPDVNIGFMGFPTNWKQEAIWQ